MILGLTVCSCRAPRLKVYSCQSPRAKRSPTFRDPRQKKMTGLRVDLCQKSADQFFSSGTSTWIDLNYKLPDFLFLKSQTIFFWLILPSTWAENGRRFWSPRAVFFYLGVSTWTVLKLLCALLWSSPWVTDQNMWRHHPSTDAYVITYDLERAAHRQQVTSYCLVSGLTSVTWWNNHVTHLWLAQLFRL